MVILMVKVVILCGMLWNACADPERGTVEGADTQILKDLKALQDGLLSSSEGRYLSEKHGVGKASTTKRGFDSIGHNNHFGGTVQTIGRALVGNDENPVFTFESLFPVLARHLRSRSH